VIWEGPYIDKIKKDLKKANKKDVDRCDFQTTASMRFAYGSLKPCKAGLRILAKC